MAAESSAVTAAENFFEVAVGSASSVESSFSTGDSLSAEGSFSAERSLSAEGSTSAEGSFSVESSFSDKGSPSTEGSVLGKDSGAGTNSILIIAGEASGDMHGAALVRALREKEPKLELFGIGGDKMAAEGFELIYRIEQMAFLGFTEVVKHLPFILKVQKTLLNEAVKRKIKKVVLIDYPGFNLKIAAEFKKLGIKVVYYIAPQVWAWGQHRVKKLKERTDIVLSVFPFEEKFFRERGVNVRFTGNPLAERIEAHNFLQEEEFRKKWGIEPEKKILAILPGSRKHEVEMILNPALDAAKILEKEFGFQTVVGCADTIDLGLLQQLHPAGGFTAVKGDQFELKKYASFGVVKSGTSTMEAALLEMPMVIVYKTSGLTYQIGKKLIKIGNLGMVNIIAGETIAPELIQNDVTGEKIANKVREVLSTPELMEKQKTGFRRIKENLGEHKASATAAEIILSET
ncbi:MAG: lipid-A-disaccharide synthase [Ignavibacteriales bacterium]|nr:MAG: lipid-A-disaccharide synthase [Ignavibacteriaceae bacterium]MBW7874281.1 lipid-A-disaccharide synthase [Ignavibacteria bacterium]MCZ2142675.1 lipid-A-disaccharide synthase [Ignavibacteriales bacterium]OQY71014.1 MAG: lipid-A-disaccharide synthase [Ignavibacteriales bacterium UTCHB3]MBV6443773.1 Lipid-A-disaccharide synthase [Ignavibacteriaceae bacterium]